MKKRVTYIRQDHIFVVNLSGSMDTRKLSEISEALRDCIRLNLRNDETIKFLFDFRKVHWDSEATHCKARDISRKYLEEFRGHSHFSAILNDHCEGKALENEFFFTQEQIAIDWLRSKKSTDNVA